MCIERQQFLGKEKYTGGRPPKVMPQSNFPNSMCKRHGTLTLKCKTKSLHFKVRMDSLQFVFLSITLRKESDRTNADFGRSAKIAGCQLSDEGSGRACT